jgi:hypothetical protein
MIACKTLFVAQSSEIWIPEVFVDRWKSISLASCCAVSSPSEKINIEALQAREPKFRVVGVADWSCGGTRHTQARVRVDTLAIQTRWPRPVRVDVRVIVFVVTCRANLWYSNRRGLGLYFCPSAFRSVASIVIEVMSFV